MQNNQKAYQLFSSFKNKHYQEETVTDSSTAVELDADMKGLLQKVNKQSRKSAATRLKALQQISELSTGKPESYFDSFLKVFAIVVEKLLTCEEDPRVLLELQRCVKAVLSQSESSVKRHFPSLFHCLYFATFDPNKDLAEAAKANLTVLLKSDEKVAKAALLMKEKLISFIFGILASKSDFIANMSVYDDKETNEVIYRKLLSMVWRTLADVVAKTQFLKPEEREVLLGRVWSVAYDSERPLALLALNGTGDDFPTRTAVMHFFSVSLEAGHQIDKSVLKKMVSSAVACLDDQNLALQEVFWRDKFVLKLLDLAKGFGVPKETVLKKSQTVFDSHCFGVGESYYRDMALFVRSLIVDEGKGRAEQITKNLLLGHFKSVTRDDLRFEVKRHYKAGFELLKELSADGTLRPEFVVKEIIGPTIGMFLSQNVHLQKNLNAVSVNLIKFYPLSIAEFIDSLKGTDEQLTQLVVASLDEVTKRTFRESLADPKAVVNLSLLLKHLDKTSQPIVVALDEFSKSVRETIVGISDLNFSRSMAVLANLRDFLKELSDVVPDSNLAQFVTDCLVSLVIEGSIEERLSDSSSANQFVGFFTDFSKLFGGSLNVDCLSQSLSRYLEKGKLEIVTQEGWQRAIGVLLETETLKTVKSTVAGFESDVFGSFSKLSKTKLPKEHQLASSFANSDSFWLFYQKMADMLFNSSVLAFTAPLFACLPLSPVKAERLITTAAASHFDSKRVSEPLPQDLFKMMVLLEAVRLSSESLPRSFVQAFEAVQCTEGLLEAIDQLDSEMLSKWLMALADRLLTQKEAQKASLSLLKRLSLSLNKRLQKSLQSSLQSFLETRLQQHFTVDLTDFNATTTVFRLIHKALPQLDLQTAVDRTFGGFLKTGNWKAATLLLSQTSLPVIYADSKMRQFWNEVVNAYCLSHLMKLQSSDEGCFEEAMLELIKQAVDNYALLSFIRRAFSQVLRDETVDERQQKSLVQKSMKLLTQSDEFVIVCRFLLSAINLRVNWSSEALKAHIGSGELTLSKSLLCLSALKDGLLTAESASFYFVPSELTDVGKLICANVEFLKLIVESQSCQQLIAATLLFDWFDFALEQKEEGIVAGNSALIEAVFEKSLSAAESHFAEQFSQSCFHASLPLLRKLITILEIFSDHFRNDVFARLSKVVFQISFETLNGKVGKTWWSVPPEFFFGEVAETISRFAIREDGVLGINTVFELLEVEVNAIKRSAFSLATRLKTPFGMTKEEIEAVSDTFDVDQLIDRFPTKVAELVLGKTAVNAFTYSLKWTALLSHCNNQSHEARLNASTLSKIFIEKPTLFAHLMTRIVHPFKNHFMTTRDLEEAIEELNFVTPETNWNEIETEELKQTFALHVFYSLSCLFPRSLRNFTETDRSFGPTAIVVLRHRISEAIFQKEIEKVELTQHEWRTSDFEVFCNRATREFSAVYLKDDSRFEVTLTLPSNYPLKQISIVIGGSARAGESKEMRWKLLLTKALTGQNNSIIDALSHWKKTMDAEFEGVDPCSICYYIIHPTSKKRPNMACKTCKKLLHSDCVRQWFQSAGKSECPLCKSQFM